MHYGVLLSLLHAPMVGPLYCIQQVIHLAAYDNMESVYATGINTSYMCIYIYISSKTSCMYSACKYTVSIWVHKSLATVYISSEFLSSKVCLDIVCSLQS